MNVDPILDRLRGLGDPKVRASNARRDAGENQFGVKMGDLRAVAKEIKTDPALASALWRTGNADARLLAVLLMRPRDLAAADLEQMVRDADFAWLADWLNGYVVKIHPEKEALRLRWMVSDHPGLLRTAWSLTAERVAKDPDGLDLPALLDRIEAEMADAPELARWTMNGCLAAIGIHIPALRERALAIGERLGVYRDYPTSKGCTSPFAPIWIAEMVRRQG